MRLLERVLEFFARKNSTKSNDSTPEPSDQNVNKIITQPIQFSDKPSKSVEEIRNEMFYSEFEQLADEDEEQCRPVFSQLRADISEEIEPGNYSTEEWERIFAEPTLPSATRRFKRNKHK